MAQQNLIGAVLEKIPYGVAVVSVGRGGVENALTVSWMTQVSFDPAMIAIAVAGVHYSEEFLRSTKNFCVNLLREDQRRVAGHFARESVTGEDKFAGIATRPAPSGAAILADSLAWLDCEVVAIHRTGDHLLVIGRIEDAGVLSDGNPLTSASGVRYQKSRAR